MPMKPSIMTRVYWRCYSWPGRTFHHTLPQILKRVAASGYEYVDLCEFPLEFWPIDLSTEDIEFLKKTLDSFGIQVSSITMPTFAAGLELLPSKKDRTFVVKRLKKAIETVSVLGGETVMYGICPRAVYGSSQKEAYRWTLNLFTECAPLAEEKDVSLAIEFVNTCFPTSSSIIKFLEKVGSRNVGLCLEVGNVRARPQKETLMEHLERCGNWVKLVHVNDPANREWLETIGVNLPETFQALKNLRYEGPIVTESLKASIPCSELDAEAARSVRYLKKMLNTLFSSSNWNSTE